MSKLTGEKTYQRLRLKILGAVQGVGFRPFIYRLANELELGGWVNNSAQGVTLEIEGHHNNINEFLIRIKTEKPVISSIHDIESASIKPLGTKRKFEIRKSHKSSQKTALILPDLATCSKCRQDIFNPLNRRYLYPFTNCTNCGPRFSIIEALPYDRINTTMKAFTMCKECREEYKDPVDRRFHAQPNACPKCGPHLELWDCHGNILNKHKPALLDAVNAIREGQVVAVKGLGGFHLMADARNNEAIRRLRQRKGREEKPFALMFPDMESIETCCEISEPERSILTSPASPIVLLQRKQNCTNKNIASTVAPGNPNLGVMLPYTPLHMILMAELDGPVVATSGNLSDEPICIDENEALTRLGKIADLFLVHNRSIARHVDDSIVRIMAGRELILRRSRGYAPYPVKLKRSIPTILAVGAHLKNTIALSIGSDVFISQHIGDLETDEAFNAFSEVIEQFGDLYEQPPKLIACDLHPDYHSTEYAWRHSNNVIPIQHHQAHILACMMENHIEGPVLGVSWDGTGYGPDGTIWGGEFLRIDDGGYKRAASLRPFFLPGGNKAVKEPKRTALGLLYELFGDKLIDMNNLPPVKAFSIQERNILITMLAKKINSPTTSSIGRLFDAVASLIDLRQVISFEGQAAMELEFLLNGVASEECYNVNCTYGNQENPDKPIQLDWGNMIHNIIHDFDNGVDSGLISAKFHNALIEAIITVSKEVGEERVVLSGGCFQNKYLTERTIRRLREEGFQPYWHRFIPPNDGGISLGQIAGASQSIKRE